MANFRALGYAFKNEGVTADYRTFPDYGISAKHGRFRVNRDVILNRGVSFRTGNTLSFSRRKRAERYALVNLNPLSNHRRFTDYYARTVINKKIFSDRRAGIDVDPRFAVRVLRHHSRNKGDAL